MRNFIKISLISYTVNYLFKFYEITFKRNLSAEKIQRFTILFSNSSLSVHEMEIVKQFQLEIYYDYNHGFTKAILLISHL